MKRKIFTLVFVLFLPIMMLSITNTASAQFDYSGVLNLTGSGADGTLVGNPTSGGGWGDTSATPLTTLSWNVTWDGSGLIHYEYTFSHPSHDTSFFILETSSNFTSSDFSNLTVTAPDEGSIGYNTEITTYGTDSSNRPGMPDSIYGLKIEMDEADTPDLDERTTFTIAFDSTRLPQWGDFYARCGVRTAHQGDPQTFNYAYNTGFVDGEPNYPEPLQVAAGDGSVANHLLVPDTVVPEPVSSTLFVVGGAFFAGRRYLRRKK
jgi:hypothetical protein